MTRTFVMGDPQAPFAKVLEVLASHDALDAARERLAEDVVLVSIGDHFDYDLRNPAIAAAEGLKILRWLASHEPEQVVLLFGNHDASRVMELALFTDDEFQRVRKLARDVDAGQPVDFAGMFPELPPPGVIGRDYASFTEEQRALVMELLLARRFKLATTGTLPDGRRALLTHAGVTARELAMLGIDDAEPELLALALERALAEAVDRVRDDWQRGELAPLSLAPLHVTGGRGEEGGGMLYHRPSNPDRPDADKKWAFSPVRPRRYDPRTLPRGLTQIVGHSGHAKCVEELAGWETPAARARKHGGIRTLRVDGERVVYDMGVAPRAPAPVADLILIDGELRRLPPIDVALLPLDSVDTG